ncbi:type II secretion system F family protein [Micromonospora sp. NPDC000316]|uniref:type II secretion system F family protein n=1 Tax=Micromonospora sp. NPDC000316 TaxID=3364216 RepID=UPI003696332B
MGSTRPTGPGRPPTRRDPRRPAATARPEAATLDIGRRVGPSVATPTIDGIDLELDWPGDSQGAPGTDGRPEGGPDIEQSDPVRADLTDPAADRPKARLAIRVGQPPTRLLLLVGLAGAGVGAVTAGPVAAVAVAGYGTLAVRALLRWRTNRLAERARRRGLDLLCGLAADLRAGLPVPPALEIAAVSGSGGSDRLRQLTSAAVRLADRTGAPLAELVERIEADARATDRGLAAAAAQAAGARATAWLLAALPVGGIGLGYGIGVDPLAVLLHSTVGGVCAVLAVALQVIGLFWAERLGAAPGRPA